MVNGGHNVEGTMKITSATVAVITGGASGIGLGIAEAVVDRGGSVVISDIRQDALPSALAHLNGRSPGVKAVGVVADVSNAAEVAALASSTLETFGRVDLICNNAGLVSPAAPTWEQDLATWDRMIQVKIMGVVHGIRAFV